MEGHQEQYPPATSISSPSPPLSSLPLTILSPQNPPYLFTPSFPSSSLNPPPLPDHLLDSHQQVQLPADVDWISLLCGQPGGLLSHDHQINNKLAMVEVSASSISAENNKIIEADPEGKNSRKRKGGGNSTTSRNMMRKANRPRFAFHTRSPDDILDDGFRWRKYGQKAVKNSLYPRSYYRCTHLTCSVKKQVQRLSKDTSIVVTTYEGVHNHPCEKLMETLAPLLKQMQFLSRF